MDEKSTDIALIFPQLAEHLPESVQHLYPYLEGFAVAIAIFVVGWIASKWVNLIVQRILKKTGKEAIATFLGNIAQYAVLAATVIAALGKVGVETTSLVAIFASAGLAIGLALQGSLANFASGVMLLVFRPFSLGDVVTIGGKTAAVDDIGIFATTMTNLDNDRIIMPNSKVFGDTIVNHTVAGTRRASIDIGVAYGVDLKDVQKVAIESAQAAELSLSEPAPAFAFVEMAASSLNFKVHVWAKSADYAAMIHEVRSELYDRLNGAGIEIPFDQIVVHKES